MFRAPAFKINEAVREVLERAGYGIDSSVFKKPGIFRWGRLVEVPVTGYIDYPRRRVEIAGFPPVIYAHPWNFLPLEDLEPVLRPEAVHKLKQAVRPENLDVLELFVRRMKERGAEFVELRDFI